MATFNDATAFLGRGWSQPLRTTPTGEAVLVAEDEEIR